MRRTSFLQNTSGQLILKEKVSTVERTPQLVLAYLGTISLQTRTKLQKSIKGVLTAVNYRLFLKVKINSVIISAFKTPFPKLLHQVWFISFSVDYPMNPTTENALDILLSEVVNILLIHL